MRTTLKLVVPLAVSVLSVSLLYASYQVRKERRNLRNDLAHRAAVLAENLQENLESSPARATDRNLAHILEKYGQREHLLGVAVYGDSGQALASTPGLARILPTRPLVAGRASARDKGEGEFSDQGSGELYLYAVPLHWDGKASGGLVIAYDTSYIQARVRQVLRDSLLNALVQTLLITALAFFLVRWTFTSPLAKTAKWLRGLRVDPSDLTGTLPQGEFFDLIHTEAKHLARDLSSAWAAAQEEAQLRESQLSLWTAERLRVSLQKKLEGNALFVLSNREPYMLVYDA